ncbi:MAG TPA: hypothetical protein VGH88_05950, partial [Streptosporangiaceae bacterium]
ARDGGTEAGGTEASGAEASGTEDDDLADAMVPEEIFAAPAAGDGPARAHQTARPPAPQPAFHRMWSSPTPPGDEDES